MTNVVEFSLLHLFISVTRVDSILHRLDLIGIGQALNRSCVVAFVESESGEDQKGYSNLLLALSETAFASDESVVFGVSNYSNLIGDPYVRISTVPVLDGDVGEAIIALQRRVPDRSCLLSSGLVNKVWKGGLYSGRADSNLVLGFINEHCGTYKSIDGSENERGQRRGAVLSNVYSVRDGPNMETILDRCSDGGSLKKFFYTGRCGGENPVALPQCETVDGRTLSKDVFFEEYLIRSKPVVIKNLLRDHWPSSSEWTNDFFRREFGDRPVHVKLTPHGEFEGVEDASLWNSCPPSLSEQFCRAPFANVPEEVRKHLTFSKNLVMVRPANLDVRLDEFIDLIEHGSRMDGFSGNASAYLEYTPVRNYFAGFDDKLPEMPFIKDLLKLDLLNMWLSDGNTLGKLHFDQYDNLLCQVSGKKRVLLFDPHDNSRFYEGHIVEATLSFHGGQFKRRELMESTALTMSPVDIEKPDFDTFPRLAGAVPINCTIESGDVLFIPSFWWHEVQSYPDHDHKRNLAFNFWYEPFFWKEFPCVECKLDINSPYRRYL